MDFFKKIILILAVGFIVFECPAFGQDVQNQTKQTPVVVNGDKVEFFHEEEKVIAEGNVEVKYLDSILTCDKIVVFTKTKEAFAEGNVRLDDARGVVKGKSLFYNFDTRKGRIIDSDFESAPYFCIAPETEKISDNIFVLYDADLTTCNLDKPHYHLHVRKAEIIPGDRLRAWGVTFFVGKIPIMYLPFFHQDIDKKRFGFSVTPGHSAEWGSYLLTDWSYWISRDVRNVLRFDWRENKGVALGFDLETYFQGFGESRLQYYYVREDLHGKGEVEPFFKDRTRHKVEYRYKWDISEDTSFVMELYDYSDVNFLKNYFIEQYEKDPQPDSYFLLSHSFPSSTLSLFVQKRLNQFYSKIEKIPEIKLSTSKQEIFESPFYWSSETSVTTFNSTTAYSDQHTDATRVDSYKQISYPFKLAFLQIEPFVGYRNTFYSEDKNKKLDKLRNIFYNGSSILTKFYRTYNNVKLNGYGIDIDKIRHIITPSIDYTYIHQPTIESSSLTAFDSIDSIKKEDKAVFKLENKLQTKRDGKSEDFLIFITEIPYIIKKEGPGSEFEDLEFDLEFYPNSWLEFDSDGIVDVHENNFQEFNFDVSFPLWNKIFDKKGSASFGYRYSRPDESKLLTFSTEHYLNPKWKFQTYHRLEFEAEKIIEEQEYSITRDLHCWEVEFTINSKKKKGTTFWLIFRCKAFPELGFDITESHQQPKKRGL